jgi:hypothetical protein
MIEFDDSLEAICYIEFPEPVNWLGALNRSSTIPRCFVVQYRFRYYVDDDNTSASKDRKSWYRGETGPCELEEALEQFRTFCRDISAVKNGVLYQCIRHGRTTQELMRDWASWPFNHLDRVTDEEFQQMQRGSK